MSQRMRGHEELRQLAEALAHEQLGHAATLRRERRKAWRRMRMALVAARRPQNLDELRVLAARLEGDMAARHGALADAAAALGDLASAEVLRGVAAEAAALLPAGARPVPTADAVVPAAAGAFDLLRTALVDLEGAYAMYLQAAEGRAGEAAMLDAQRWAASALRRSGAIRGRLTALVRGDRPDQARRRHPALPAGRGPALFAAGFRPFFLAAGAWAVAGAGLVARGADRPDRPPVRVRRHHLACA